MSKAVAERVRVYFDDLGNEVLCYYDRPLWCNETVWLEMKLIELFKKQITFVAKPPSKENILISVPILD